MTLKTTDLNAISAQELVDILTGGGVTVENIQVTGSPQAIGSFINDRSAEETKGIGIDEGVILSSGDIANAIGPNDSDSETGSFETPGDPDLDKLLNPDEQANDSTENKKTTNDAVVLEFDFIPQYEQFLFEYVFASEEYNEFVGKGFNDIFAFFLNGKNIALIPGTATPVAIDNVNAGNNKAFYLNNRSEDINDGQFPYDTEFDGFTIPFAAQQSVIPGEKQHLKLVIADQSDTAYDSAVFLKQGSLQTLPPAPDAKLTVDDKDLFTIEGSRGFATLKFTLTGDRASSIAEVGVFVVDDEEGKIAGVAPGEKDYEKLAMTGSRSRVIFAGSPHDLPDSNGRTRLLNYNTSDRLGFYLVTNGTTDSMLSDFPKGVGFGQFKSEIFFTFPEQNRDRTDHLQVSEDGGIFTLNWEESLYGYDFDDLSLSAELVDPSQAGNLPMGARRQGELEMEIIDLSRLKDGESLKANFEAKSDALFNDTIGFYQVQDEHGTIIDNVTGQELTPDNKNYAAVAINQRILEIDREGEASLDLSKGLFAPFIIANGTIEQWQQENPYNWSILGKEKIVAYFPYIEANPDGFEHVVLLEDNTFGFEDRLAFPADRDYNDAIVQVNF
jgi:hypothetical protein